MLAWPELLAGAARLHFEAPLDHTAAINMVKLCLKPYSLIYGVLISCDITWIYYFIVLILYNHYISWALLKATSLTNY